MARGLPLSIIDLLKSTPVDPFLIIETSFGTFSEREDAETPNGKILEIGSLDTGTRVDGSGGGGSVSIKLSDTTGYLLSIYNTKNLHSEYVKVFQAFHPIGLASKFLIFEGFIQSPIVWDEGTRTLSFDIVTKTEDLEVGFAPEDGQFTNLKLDFIGKAWPLAFGKAQYIPALKLQEMPTSILLSDFGIPDVGILDQIQRLRVQSGGLQVSTKYDYIDASASLEEVNARLQANSKAAQQEAEQILAQQGEIAKQIKDLQAEYDDQKKWLPGEKYKQSSAGNTGKAGANGGELTVIMQDFPTGSFMVKINETMFIAAFRKEYSGDPAIPYENQPQFTRDYNKTDFGYMTLSFIPETAIDTSFYIIDSIGQITGPPPQKYGFRYFPTGSTITIIDKFPIPYVCNIVASHVLGVYAYRSYNGTRTLTKIPEKYYRVGSAPAFNAGRPTLGDNTISEFDNDPNGALNVLGINSGNGDVQFTAAPDTISGRQWFSPVFINMDRPMSLTSFFFNNEVKSVEWLHEYYQFNKNKSVNLTVAGFAKSSPIVVKQEKELTKTLKQAPVKEEPINPYGNIYGSHIQATEEWEDDIYVLLESSVGPNIVDIMQWIIVTFTSMKIDPFSFAFARQYLANYPSNFALFEKQDAYTLLTDIAYQTRCALYIKENTFYIKYLPNDEFPIDTITEDDIVQNSLSYTTSSSEEVLTKLVGNYRFNYLGDTQNAKVIVNVNVAKYGVKKEEHNYFIYSNHYLVKKSLTFWLIRRGNVWKKVKFKTYIDKLNIETFDSITLDFKKNPISTLPVKGVVESAVYNSNDNTIDMVVWLPIVAGRMDAHNLAFPRVTYDRFPTIHEITSGGGTQNLIPFQAIQLPNYTQANSAEFGGYSVDSFGVLHDTINTIGRPDSYGVLRPGDTRDGTKGVPTSPLGYDISQTPEMKPYNLQDYTPKVSAAAAAGATNVFIGKVVSGKGNKYKVDLFGNGTENEKTATVQVIVPQIDSTEQIPEGTVLAAVHMFTDEDTQENFYESQPPVWL